MFGGLARSAFLVADLASPRTTITPPSPSAHRAAVCVAPTGMRSRRAPAGVARDQNTSVIKSPVQGKYPLGRQGTTHIVRERNDRGNRGSFSEERIVPGTSTSTTKSTSRRRSVIGVELSEPTILGERPASAHHSGPYRRRQQCRRIPRSRHGLSRRRQRSG